MAAFGAVQGLVSPELLVTTINQELNNASPTQSTIYQDISVVADSPGEVEVFPMNRASLPEIDLGWNEKRSFSTPYTLELSCAVNRISFQNWIWNSIPDAYNTLRNPEDIIGRAIKVWDRKLAALINRNGLSYDSSTFFSASHPVNPSVPGAGTYSNDFVGFDIDENGVTTMMQNLINILGADGNLYNADLGTPEILVPTWAMYIKARHLLFPGLNAVPVGVAGASQTTQLEGFATLRYFPELFNPAVQATGKTWYLVRTNDGRNKPLITRIKERPNLKYFGEGSQIDFDYGGGVVACAGMAVGGVNYGLPQLMLRVLAP
jgi:hypothetical protein